MSLSRDRIPYRPAPTAPERAQGLGVKAEWFVVDPDDRARGWRADYHGCELTLRTAGRDEGQGWVFGVRGPEGKYTASGLDAQWTDGAAAAERSAESWAAGRRARVEPDGDDDRNHLHSLAWATVENRVALAIGLLAAAAFAAPPDAPRVARHALGIALALAASWSGWSAYRAYMSVLGRDVPTLRRRLRDRLSGRSRRAREGGHFERLRQWWPHEPAPTTSAWHRVDACRAGTAGYERGLECEDHGPAKGADELREARSRASMWQTFAGIGVGLAAFAIALFTPMMPFGLRLWVVACGVYAAAGAYLQARRGDA